MTTTIITITRIIKYLSDHFVQVGAIASAVYTFYVVSTGIDVVSTDWHNDSMSLICIKNIIYI
jgi:hypothetical protein